MCLDKLVIKSNIRDYSVYFESDDKFLHSLAQKDNSVFIVDEKVYNLYKDGFLSSLPQERLITLEINEEMKNISTVCSLYEQIMSYSPRKNMTIISIGGGIIQDVSGFVASSLYRGVNWIFVPTTLLAQSDSCIGAKTSLNFNHYKNLVGTFYPPSEVYIFPQFLKTLSREDFYSGVGEIAKLHLMSGVTDTESFIKSLSLIELRDCETLLSLILNSLKIKQSYIENDEFDTGRRNLLNYGHCFGHAIESSTDFTISHGQAVVLGMILANSYAKHVGVLSEEFEKYIKKNVLDPILVVEIPDIDVNRTVASMRQDKKNLGNGLALVMLTDNYNMQKINNLSESEAEEVLRRYVKN